MNSLDFSKRIETSRVLYTAQITRELDVTVAAVNFVFLQDRLITIEFNSYLLGITKYSLVDKKFYGNTWESETDAKAISSLNYHYTSIGLNGEANEETNQKIFNAVMNCTNNNQLKELITKVINLEPNMELAVKEFFQEKLLN